MSSILRPFASAVEADETGFLLAATPMPFAHHAFGTRACGATAEAALRHAQLELGGAVAHMKQVHGADILEATQGGCVGACDAVFTTQPNLWLAVKTADCTPVLVSSPKAVAAVHLGWRSVQAGLLPKVLHQLTDGLGQSPADLYLALGPALSQRHFEVEGRFIEAFGGETVLRFFGKSANPGKVMMDLAGIIKAQARAVGVPDSHVQALGHCTYTKEDVFFSYRRDKENPGRQVSVICRAE